jgi:putative ABC transport system ATP-binding protein
MVLVTHNAAIAKMADRVLGLRDGCIVDDRRNPEPVAAGELEW